MGWDSYSAYGAKDDIVDKLIIDGEQDRSKLNITSNYASIVQYTPLFTGMKHDIQTWKYSINGEFTYNSAIQSVRMKYDEVTWYKTVWAKANNPKTSMCAYKAIN